MPIAGGPSKKCAVGLLDLDGEKQNALGMKMNQKELRQWKRNTEATEVLRCCAIRCCVRMRFSAIGY